MRSLKGLACVLLFATSVTGDALADGDCDDQVALIQLAQGASIDTFHAQFGTSTIDAIPSRGIYLVATGDGVDFSDLQESAAGSPLVDTLEQNCLVTDTSPEGGTRTFFFNTLPGAFQNQPAVEIIGLADAHNGSLGQDVLVAVLDTGISAHPQIAARIASGGFNFLANNAQVAESGDGFDNDGDGFVDEMVGHGTFIAGLVIRAAPQARLLPVKVMDDEGVSSTFLLTAGIYHAVDAGADVINVSMGSTEPSTILEQAVTAAGDAGAIVVASAGNESADSPIRYPAGYAGVVAVAATDANDVRADFSNFGTHVSITAPGVALASTGVGDDFVAASGTSFSAPLVGGALALLRAADPSASTEQLRHALLSTTVNIEPLNPSYVGQLGSGRLDCRAALQSPSLCAGDVNLDRRLDLADLSSMLANFGQTGGASRAEGDVTGDGAVTLDDLTLLLSRFGQVCD